jgi:hypothetical protein
MALIGNSSLHACAHYLNPLFRHTELNSPLQVELNKVAASQSIGTNWSPSCFATGYTLVTTTMMKLELIEWEMMKDQPSLVYYPTLHAYDEIWMHYNPRPFGLMETVETAGVFPNTNPVHNYHLRWDHQLTRNKFFLPGA